MIEIAEKGLDLDNTANSGIRAAASLNIEIDLTLQSLREEFAKFLKDLFRK